MIAIDNTGLKDVLCGCVKNTITPKATVELAAGVDGESNPTRTLTVTDASTFSNSDTFKVANVQVVDSAGKIYEDQITAAAGSVTFDFLDVDITEGFGVNVTVVSTNGYVADGAIQMPPFDAKLDAGKWDKGERPVAQ